MLSQTPLLPMHDGKSGSPCHRDRNQCLAQPLLDGGQGKSSIMPPTSATLPEQTRPHHHPAHRHSSPTGHTNPGENTARSASARETNAGSRENGDPEAIAGTERSTLKQKRDGLRDDTEKEHPPSSVDSRPPPEGGSRNHLYWTIGLLGFQNLKQNHDFHQ